MNFKNLKFTRISSTSQPASQPSSQPAVRPGCTSAMALEDLQKLSSDLQNCCSEKRLSTAPWCFLLSFIS